MNPAPDSIDWLQYLGSAVRFWWLVIGGIVLFGVAGWYIAWEPETYTATATLLVDQGNAAPSLSEIQLNRELTLTATQLVTLRPVLSRAVEHLADGTTVEELRSSITAKAVTPGSLLAITALHPDAARAELFARAVAESFIEETTQSRLANIARIQTAASAQGIQVDSSVISGQLAVNTFTLVEPPTSTRRSTIGKVIVNTLAGAFVGLVVGVSASIMLDRFSGKIRSPKRCEELFDLPTVGIVRRWRSNDPASRQIAIEASPNSELAESYRYAASNLWFVAGPTQAKVILVTSAGSGDGKTATVVNLACALAERSGSRILIIDGDLRKPTLGERLGVGHESSGLSALLADWKAELRGTVLNTRVPGVSILPAGPIPPNPTPLLTSPRLERLIEELKDEYSTILIDTSPMLLVADVTSLGRIADGMIIVVDAERTRWHQISSVVQIANRSGTRILGTLFNRAPTARSVHGYGYGYGYEYGYGYGYGTASGKPSDNTGTSANGRAATSIESNDQRHKARATSH